MIGCGSSDGKLVGDVREISAGDEHVCAVLDGMKVRCIGSNMYGQCNVPDFMVE